jgi:hypothetical protein
MPPKLTPEIVTAAIEGFEAQKKRLDDQIAELRQMLNPGPATEAPAAPPVKRKRRLSAAGRKAIGDAARRRWAAINAAQAEPASTPAKAAPQRASSKASAKRAATRKRAATKTPGTSPNQNSRVIHLGHA